MCCSLMAGELINTYTVIKCHMLQTECSRALHIKVFKDDLQQNAC